MRFQGYKLSIAGMIIVLCYVTSYSQLKKDNPLKNTISQVCFRENKGQISDQYFVPRKDVLFSGSDGCLVYFLKEKGISYQLNKVDKWEEKETDLMSPHTGVKHKAPSQLTVYRIDINWLNTSAPVVIAKDQQEGYDNFYLQSCPNGALFVKSYRSVLYKNLYPGVDLKWYEKDGSLKYDYLMSPGSDYRQISFEINGAEKISVNERGELMIKTPLGELSEAAPLVLQDGKKLPAKWKIKENHVSFEIKNIDSSLPFVIDPLIRVWGTYYGSLLDENGWHLTTDAASNVFLSGDTKSNTSLNIATVGSHQSTYGGPGSAIYQGDAFVVKFNSSGVRQWATYYGGSGSEFANMCAVDGAGYSYLTGGTTSTLSAVMTTVGGHQTILGGGLQYGDAFLVKFNAAGVRQWATYYGGSNEEAGYGVCVDGAGNVCMSGFSSSSNTNVISTVGSHQVTLSGIGDAFLVKFDAGGTRQWGTYYGGTGGFENGQACEFDISGNIYMIGHSNSNGGTGVATIGSHQQVFGGGQADGMLVKFNSSGVRQWGTYYGGTARDMFYGMKISNGNVYITGETFSAGGTSIATPGTHQPLNGGGCDALLVKFDLNGIRIWGTYYGGGGNDSGIGTSVDAAGDVYISGLCTTNSGTAIATPCTYQDIYGGGNADAFLGKLNSSGARKWGTYYGGNGFEYWGSCTNDASGAVFLAGRSTTNTGTIIPSSNGHQFLFGGGNSDAFVVKFDGCIQNPPPNTTPTPSMEICYGQSTSLSTSVACGVNWYSSPGGSVIGTTSVLSTPTLAANTNYYIEDLSCGPGSALTLVTVTVIPLPDVQVATNNTLFCSGNTVTLTASGATNFTWSPSSQISSSIVISPASSTIYSVTGDDGNCIGSNTIAVNVVITPTLLLNYNQNVLCYNSAASITVTGAQSYSWLPSSVLTTSSGSVVSTFSLTSSESFTVIGENASGPVFCFSQSVFSLNVFPQLFPVVSPSISICEGNKGILSAGGGNTYLWTGENIDHPTQSGIVIAPTKAGVYAVDISYNSVCPVTATVFVNVDPKPLVYAGADTTINIGDPVFISATGSGVLKWVSGENIGCIDCPSTSVYPYTKSCYVVEATDNKGCKAQDEVCIEIVKDYGIYIPNTFTPNNDGLNDIFYVYGFGIKDYKLTVYDRWGIKLFTSTDQSEGWNGFYNNELCEQGTYIYYVEFWSYQGKHEVRPGHVNLLRGKK